MAASNNARYCETADKLNGESTGCGAGCLQVFHGPYGKGWLIRIRTAHRAGQRHRQKLRISAGANRHGHRQAGLLSQRSIQRRAGSPFQAVAQNVTDDPDDRHPSWIRSRPAEIESPSDRILSREILPGRLVTDHRDLMTARVGGVEDAPLAHRNAHQGKVLRRNDVGLDHRKVGRWVWRRSVDGDRRDAALAVERQTLDDRR